MFVFLREMGERFYSRNNGGEDPTMTGGMVVSNNFGGSHNEVGDLLLR